MQNLPFRAHTPDNLPEPTLVRRVGIVVGITLLAHRTDGFRYLSGWTTKP